MRVRWTSPDRAVETIMRQNGAEYDFGDDIAADLLERGLCEAVAVVPDAPAPMDAPAPVAPIGRRGRAEDADE